MHLIATYLQKDNVSWLIRLGKCVSVFASDTTVFHLLACRVRICHAEIGESRIITKSRTAANGRVE